MSDLPTWLSDAVGSLASSMGNELTEESPAETLPGDICVVKPFDRGDAMPRLFVVVDAADGWCDGMLASVETELATEVDLILPPSETGLGYAIAVHTRYLGPIWITQVQRRVGAVTSETLAQLESLSWNDEAQVTFPVGIPLQPDNIDPRYPTLRTLSSEFDALTDHCRRRRHEFEHPILDPALAGLGVLRTILAERGWESRVGSALSNPEFRDRLLDALPHLSLDERRSVMPLLERATVGGPTPAITTETVPALSRHADPNALARVIASNSEGTVVTVLSHRDCWHHSPARSVRVRLSAREECIVFEPFSDVQLAEAA